MKHQPFTQSQQEELRKSPHILRVSNTNITFSPEFKNHAVERAATGLTPQSVFAEAGIPTMILGKRPKNLIRMWRKVVNQRGAEGLAYSLRGKSQTGGRPKKERIDVSKMTDKEKIEYYKTRAEYTDAENAFLAEARGLKRWPEFRYESGKSSN